MGTDAVRTEHRITAEFKIKKGVRQSCIPSPSLFNLYTIFREIEDMTGINIGSVNINNLRCGFSRQKSFRSERSGKSG